MKKKLLFFILVLSLCVLPNSVKARTLDEANAIFNALSFEIVNGDHYFNIFSIPFETIWENSCDNMTVDEMLERNPWLAESGVNLDDALVDAKSDCHNEVVNMFFEDYSYKFFRDEYAFSVEYLNNTNEISVSVNYDDEDGNSQVMSKTAKVKFVNVDEDILNSANEIASKIDIYHNMSGLNSISSFYHYGYVLETDTQPLKALYRMDNLKEVCNKNPDFYFSVPTSGGGSTPFYAGMSGVVNIYKNNVLYASKLVTFDFNTVIAVDKDASGTVFEKAENRINEFFKNKVNVSVNDENFVEYKNDMMLNDTCNRTFGTGDLEYVAYYTSITIDGEEYNIAIVEVDGSLLDKYEVTARHYTTGVSIYTNGFEVPKDSGIFANENKNDFKKIFDKKYYNLINAFDIDLINGDGNLINQIEDGVEVYIPITGYKVGDNLGVFHIENEEKKEEYKGEVVELDGKQYVKFRTTHFSTYAVAESVEEVANPNTGDNIIYTFIFVLLSISGLVVVYKLKPKFN